jgi:hypothetical protein
LQVLGTVMAASEGGTTGISEFSTTCTRLAVTIRWLAMLTGTWLQ